ncbi:YqiA/YcfP family alpha/beta fold hydrolase [uncultured Salegentibacter sp.]|uniref:YqiA/YcfP family alpha/beta fold hydrolase n=1 Tax=uncultured Salegentibacter sp. TaxID=259320 RepID=UPI0025963A64|nr:YqiA/YcfP family alpha/beta fold hydrolase [uncultured Salegentibacter sp.]
MYILYLHGLHSKLSNEKREVLEQYGQVFAPDINYSEKHFQPDLILKQFPNTEFNVVMGSSMGALNAYAISEIIGRPALLFNPPLVKYREIEFSHKFTRGLSTKQILLGGSDDVVNAAETLNFLGKNLQKSELNIKVLPQLGHQIPIDIFTDRVKKFFKDICA